MNCQIPYILNTVKDSGLDEDKYISLATKAHKDVVTSLFNSNIVFTLENEGVKRLYLKHENINNPTILQALKLKGFYDEDENKSVIKFFDTEIKGKPYTYIGINVFNSPSLIDENIPTISKIDKTYESQFFDELFVLPSIAKLQSHLEQVVNKDSESVLEKFADEIVTKLRAYENSLGSVSDNYQLAVSKTEIRKILNSLENRDNIAIASGIDRYVRGSVFKLNYLSQLFFGATKEFIKREEERKRLYEEKLKEFPDNEFYKIQIERINNTLASPPKSIKERLKVIEEKRKSNNPQDKKDVEIELRDINDLLQQGR